MDEGISQIYINVIQWKDYLVFIPPRMLVTKRYKDDSITFLILNSND